MEKGFAVSRKVEITNDDTSVETVEYLSVIGNKKDTKKIFEKWLDPEHVPSIDEAMMSIHDLNDSNDKVAEARKEGRSVVVKTAVEQIGAEGPVIAEELDKEDEKCGEEDCGSCNTPSCHSPKAGAPSLEDEEPMPEPSREFAEQKLDAIVNMAKFFDGLAKIATDIKEKAKEDDFEAALLVKASFYDIDAALSQHPEVEALTKLDLKKVNRWFNEIAGDLLNVPLKEEGHEVELKEKEGKEVGK